MKYQAALLRALSIVAVLQLVTGCLPPDMNAPSVEIRVRQVDGQVSFESILQDRILLLIPHPVRLRVSSLEVKDPQGEVIWMIRSFPSDSDAAGQQVHYGVLPDGFKQVMPKQGRATGLKTNSEYAVHVSWSVIGSTTKFVYNGPN